MRSTDTDRVPTMTRFPPMLREWGRVGLPRVPPAEHHMVMPAVSRRWTAREVRALIEQNPLKTPRYELVDGELLVTPSPSFDHALAVSQLLGRLFIYLEEQAIGVALTSPSDVELEPEFLTQPDVYAIANSELRRLMRRGEKVTRELILVVEVLSPRSGRHDRVRKRPLYQRHVPEYWIVDLDARLIERWRMGDDRPEMLTERLEWNPAGASQPFLLDLAPFFARILNRE